MPLIAHCRCVSRDTSPRLHLTSAPRVVAAAANAPGKKASCHTCGLRYVQSTDNGGADQRLDFLLTASPSSHSALIPVCAYR